MIREAIMATDMGVHKDICTELQKRAEQVATAQEKQIPLEKPSFDIRNYEDRIFLVRSIVHTADLSGQAMPKEVAYKFGAGVLSEFHNQYGLEQKHGLALSGYMKVCLAFVCMLVGDYIGRVFWGREGAACECECMHVIFWI